MNNNKINLCVIFGGRSSEYEVSLLTAYSIITNADREKYDITTLGITPNGQWMLYEGDPECIRDGTWRDHPECLTSAYITPDRGLYAILTRDGRAIYIDVVFPAVHGEYSEDGRLQGLLELVGIPFVGSGTKASAAAMDKATTKALISLTDVPQAKAVVLTKESMKALAEVEQRVESELGYPVFVKPSSAGSSVGVSKVKCREELLPAVEKALKTDPQRVLIEEFIDGREIEVAVIGNDDPIASVCGEIDPGAEFYDYDTKYKNDTASYYIPARLPDEISSKVREWARKVYVTLGAQGLSRVDFFVKADGGIIFNEINTLPGFTSISMYPKLICESGMTYPQVIDRLIELAFDAQSKR